MLFIYFNCIKQVEGERRPPEKRRRSNDHKYYKNISSPSVDSFVHHYDQGESDSELGEEFRNYYKIDQSDEDFIPQSTSKEISKVVEPLKSKVLLSTYSARLRLT